MARLFSFFRHLDVRALLFFLLFYLSFAFGVLPGLCFVSVAFDGYIVFIFSSFETSSLIFSEKQQKNICSSFCFTHLLLLESCMGCAFDGHIGFYFFVIWT